MIEDEDLLMAVLNSAPVIDGTPTEQLGGSTGGEVTGRFGGTGTPDELVHLRNARAALHGVIRGEDDAVELLTQAVEGAVLVPEATEGGVRWQLDVPADQRLAVRTVLAWSRAVEELPGRLRACANTECNLYLIDHSRPGKAKWCSMATCGNRMKVRAHARRARAS